MDVGHYLAAQATAYIATSPNLSAVIRGVSWSTTILSYANMIIESEPLEAAIEVLEVTGQSLETLTEPPEPPSLDTSVEIGGPGVEAHAAEIKQLQAEHEAAVKNLTDQFSEERRKQLDDAQAMEQNYFDRHPDQTPDERDRDAKMLDGVKQDAMNDLSAKQEARMAELLQAQQREIQQLQERQVAQDQRQAQVRAEFRDNRDDLLR